MQTDSLTNFAYSTTWAGQQFPRAGPGPKGSPYHFFLKKKAGPYFSRLFRLLDPKTDVHSGVTESNALLFDSISSELPPEILRPAADFCITIPGKKSELILRGIQERLDTMR